MSGQAALFFHCHSENCAQLINPLIRLTLTHTGKESNHCLKRIYPEIKQNEKQSVFSGQKLRFPTASVFPFPMLILNVSFSDIPVPCFFKLRYQVFKFRPVETG